MKDYDMTYFKASLINFIIGMVVILYSLPAGYILFSASTAFGFMFMSELKKTNKHNQEYFDKLLHNKFSKDLFDKEK